MTEALDDVAAAQAPEPKVRYELAHGDALDVLKHLPDACCDSLVCDPPAGIDFMGKHWDQDHGGRVHWIEAFAAIFREALRVLKPGAHGLVWALPRTSHWTATALEEAGFEIRDVVTHLFGTGFPKSLDVSKAIDKAAGAKREVIGESRWAAVRGTSRASTQGASNGGVQGGYNMKAAPNETAPSSESAKQWSGWGTALKPASEHWILIRKPLDGTVASNVLAHGTGGINIDGCRIAGAVPSVPQPDFRNVNGRSTHLDAHARNGEMSAAPGGRWPANIVLSHNEDCVVAGKRKVGSGERRAAAPGEQPFKTSRGWNQHSMTRDGATAPESYGAEEIDAYECTPGCAVAMLDAQDGGKRTRGNRKQTTGGGGTGNSVVIGDKHFTAHHERTELDISGGASRFFYVAKASKRDRNGGLPEGKENKHPTVKNTSLMDWLIRLITPPGGVVLDWCMGSGSTGVAALLAGFRFFGIERELESFEVATHRIEEAAK